MKSYLKPVISWDHSFSRVLDEFGELANYSVVFTVDKLHAHLGSMAEVDFGNYDRF